jgi:hypothetical protein
MSASIGKDDSNQHLLTDGVDVLDSRTVHGRVRAHFNRMEIALKGLNGCHHRSRSSALIGVHKYFLGWHDVSMAHILGSLTGSVSCRSRTDMPCHSPSLQSLLRLDERRANEIVFVLFCSIPSLAWPALAPIEFDVIQLSCM